MFVMWYLGMFVVAVQYLDMSAMHHVYTSAVRHVHASVVQAFLSRKDEDLRLQQLQDEETMELATAAVATPIAARSVLGESTYEQTRSSHHSISLPSITRS